MADIIGRPRLELEVGKLKYEKQLDGAAASLGASLKASEKLTASGAKRIQAQIDKLNAVKPRQAMADLGLAIQKMGGLSKLSGNQVDRLRKQVEGLAAAGAKVPKNLAGLGGIVGTGAGAKVATAVGGNLAAGLAPVGALGAGLTALGPAGLAAAAGIGAVALAGKAAADTVGALVARASQLTDLHEQTKISTDFLQKLDFVGGQAGVSLEASAGAVLKLQRSIGEASQGSVEARAHFDAIGVSWKDLQGLAPEKQFAMVSSALATIPDQERLVAAGADLMGRGFSEIIPLIRHAHELLEAPVALSADVIKQADEIGDAMTRLGTAAEEVKLQIGAAFLGLLSAESDPAAAIDTMTDAMRGLAKVVEKPSFQAALRGVLGVGTLGLSEVAIGGVGQLAQLGKKTPAQRGFQGQVDRARMVADAQKQIAAEMGQLRKKKADERKAGEPARRKAASAAAKAAAEQQAALKREVDLHEDINKAIDFSIKEMGQKALLEQDAVRNAGREAFLLKESAEARRVAAARAGGLREGAMVPSIGGAGFFTRSPEVLAEEIENAAGEADKVVKATFDLQGALEGAALLAGLMGDNLGAMVGIVGNIGDAFRNAKTDMDKFGAIASGVGQIGGLVGGKGGNFLQGAAGGSKLGASLGSIIPGVGTLAGGVLGGLAGGIVGLFKKDPIKDAMKAAGKILGTGISREMAEQFVAESKRTGKSIATVTKEWQKDQEKAAADAKRQTMEEGVGAAKSGLDQILQAAAKLKDTPELAAAIAGVEAKVAEAMAKSGLGFLATGVLRESEAFGAAQSAAAGGGQVLAGMRQAGMVDAGLTAAVGGLAVELQKQAIEAARTAGLSDQEAAKAGSGAIADILREQLNASIASGHELDANTRALIDEAKANGIEIIADPLLQQLKVQQKSLAELQAIARTLGGGSAIEGFARFAAGDVMQAASGLRPAIMPNVGGGLGPLIQTHPGELALVIPRNRMGGRRRMFRQASAGLGDAESFSAPRGGFAGDGAAMPIVLNAEFHVRLDPTMSVETGQQLSRMMAREARRLFDHADPDFVRAARRRLGLAT